MAPVISIRKGRPSTLDVSARDTINRIRRPLDQKLVGIDVLKRQHDDAVKTLSNLKRA